ncbi:MAG: FAD synthase [Parcubacteria group bacterium GW2011_GWA1_47_10]|nr:MAG: FAD synthase [Parcubacteria group bacterium GW2011_GWA1_47_10]
MSKKLVEKIDRQRRVKIMVFGTFDGLHPGHLDFFRQARDLAARSLLTVSVARDGNVKRIKGRRPVLTEKKRAALLKKTNAADRVILGGLTNHLAHILKARPDIIALGYDQRDYVKNLKKDLKEKGLTVKIVRLKPYKEKIYKNALLRPRK